MDGWMYESIEEAMENLNESTMPRGYVLVVKRSVNCKKKKGKLVRVYFKCDCGGLSPDIRQMTTITVLLGRLKPNCPFDVVLSHMTSMGGYGSVAQIIIILPLQQ
jgi:hypothetical protein